MCTDQECGHAKDAKRCKKVGFAVAYYPILVHWSCFKWQCFAIVDCIRIVDCVGWCTFLVISSSSSSSWFLLKWHYNCTLHFCNGGSDCISNSTLHCCNWWITLLQFGALHYCSWWIALGGATGVSEELAAKSSGQRPQNSSVFPDPTQPTNQPTIQ